MKQIEAIQIWSNGILKTANWLVAVCYNDNLLDSASFNWALYENVEDNRLTGIVSEGNITMDQQEYNDWNSDPDINNAAYNWIADGANVLSASATFLIAPANMQLGGGATLIFTANALTNNAGLGAGTLGNAPTAGDPTKWIRINDAGVARFIPTWT